MEVYILDSLYRRVEVIDKFESLIWTERFSAAGDFQLEILSSLDNRIRFPVGTRFAMTDSYRVMTVETVEDVTDDEGRRILKIKGPSLENVFVQRLAYPDDTTNLTDNPKWILTGTPKEIADQLFHDICVTGVFDTGDIISGITEDNIFPADTIDFPIDEITYLLDPKDLYTALKDLCDVYLMGFRLVRDLDGSLHFDVYMGSDRTTQQTGLPAVVFSPDLENLRNTSLLMTSALYKNTAYVLSPVGIEIVYSLDVDSTVAGFERRVLIVVAQDITDPTPATATALMIQRGEEELAKNRKLTVLDGEIAAVSQFKYGVHYNLGDLVELRDDDGSTSIMQVTEQIFVSDKEGDRSFPTLSVNQFIQPDSWVTFDVSDEWIDFTTEEWDDFA